MGQELFLHLVVDIAGLAEAKLIANYWLRAGNTACVNGAAEFLRQTVQGLPKHIRICAGPIQSFKTLVLSAPRLALVTLLAEWGR